jgi:hypothetical protein
MSFLIPKPIKDIPHPYVIVCEGMGDAGFVEALLRHKKVENCCVGCPSDETAGGSGFEAIPAYLKGIAMTARRAGKSLEGLAVIADANGDPDGRFAAVAAAMRLASFPEPAQPFVVDDGPPRNAVFLIPGAGENGTLENLLLKAAFRKTPVLERCIEEFSTCTGMIATATDNQKAKMKMSAIAAAFCKDNPWTSIRLLWKDKGNPVPIDSDCFDELSRFIDNFSTPAAVIRRA